MESSLKEIQRDEKGLLKDFQYQFDERGLIDWRKMVRPEFLVPNAQRTSELDISKIPDSDLLIKLGGLKELAQVRGFKNVSYRVGRADVNYVLLSCKIDWIGNYETEGREMSFESVGDASERNTSGFARNFLGAIAENRAFARCVRNFLRINVAAQEEIGGEEQPIPDPSDELRKKLTALMAAKGIKFRQIQGRLIQDGVQGAEGMTQVSHIPSEQLPYLIERLAKYNPS